MILLYTDFGRDGPYVGQMHTVLAVEAPGVPVIDLMHDAPAFDPVAAGALLAALRPWIPAGAVVVAVVDPGVGTDRPAVALHCDGRWFVGPDNGLLATTVRRAPAADTAAWTLTWRPERLSASFHGRDLFAPVAARLARGEPVPGAPRAPASLDRAEIADPLPAIIAIDGYGNAMTGLPAAETSPDALLAVAGRRLRFARTFGAAPPDRAFWYANSLGLVEIAVRNGNAAARLSLRRGQPVALEAELA